MTELRAPFPYFGGKSSVADLVWNALGNPKHYIEPFFGSGAVLLAREKYDHSVYIETVNDKDCFLANVWRSLQFSPDETAKWCDWPVNHVDLMARKSELLRNKDKLSDGLASDPKWHDPVLAGYWIWSASCWIGSGLNHLGQRPHLSNGGHGVHALGQRPHLSNGGKGVQEPYNVNIYKWFRELSERLRYVRVVCGDWTRVCGGNWHDNEGDCGIFFDPPYAVDDRDDVYDEDSKSVADDVRKWCIERGGMSSYRIVLAGYDEHEDMASHGWRKYVWKTRGGYGNLGDGQGKNNAARETLWFSPHCVESQLELFA